GAGHRTRGRPVVSEQELREALERIRGQADQMQAELDNWEQICGRLVQLCADTEELRREATGAMRMLAGALRDSRDVMAAMNRRLEADQDQADWWKG
ncbi:hypothetical protein, partial [Botrimarina sp.]|uniref:hypothetical protein n=1 Tax=Botrimarina sp. TaxID=2795802 RepID=UPI0032ED4BC3